MLNAWYRADGFTVPMAVVLQHSQPSRDVSIRDQKSDTAAHSAWTCLNAVREVKHCGLPSRDLFTGDQKPDTAAQSASKGSVYSPPEARLVSRQRLQSRHPKSPNLYWWHFAEIRRLRAVG